jgi:hypothetical protein
MKIAKIILAGTAALTIISSAAFAQQGLTGTVTQVNRINRTVAIKQTQAVPSERIPAALPRSSKYKTACR